MPGAREFERTEVIMGALARGPLIEWKEFINAVCVCVFQGSLSSSLSLAPMLIAALIPRVRGVCSAVCRARCVYASVCVFVSFFVSVICGDVQVLGMLRCVWRCWDG